MRLKYEIAPLVKKKLEDAIFVGRLVNSGDLVDTPLTDSVFWKDDYKDDVSFLIKCISPMPEEVSQNFLYSNNIITGSTISNNNLRKLNELIDYQKTPIQPAFPRCITIA